MTGAAVMPVAVIVLIFLFDWRLGICCLIPMGISVIRELKELQRKQETEAEGEKEHGEAAVQP